MTDRKASRGVKPDWVTQIADRVVRRAERDAEATGGDVAVVCASGLSPSGPIHLGNLREILVQHYVAEEIKSRGVACEHILSWDDYDRFRKVPAGVDEGFAEHVGKPLTVVPDPEGELSSWAERFKQPLREALVELGVELREISQSEQYTSGAYREQILTALDRRAEIDEVLGRFRTLEEAHQEETGEDRPETEAEDGDDGGVEGGEYWPFKVYCQQCQRDDTEMTAYEDDGQHTWISYRCTACGHEGRFDLRVENHGKLVWKVDWPMRWAYEGVTFEAAGADHSSPGSSFSVGAELVERIYGGKAPEYEAYSFVGTRGVGKLSSSSGAVPTPSDALTVLEPAILRWMYVRKSPRQAITVDLSTGLLSLYDEWDALTAKVGEGTAPGGQAKTHQRASHTAVAELGGPATVVPFRTLTSAAAVGAGDDAQIARIVGELASIEAEAVEGTEPRLTKARHWVDHFAPESERITVRAEADRVRLQALDATESDWLDLLLRDLEADWSLEGARTLVYGVPKLAAGLDLDADPTDELKAQQRTFFKLLYQLLLSADTGPRMPTLLMALGPERVRALLTA